MPIIEGSIPRGQPQGRPGVEYYVDTGTGSDSSGGTSWDTAFLTMAKAFTVIASGDSIAFVGKIQEQLTTPVQVFDVRIRGGGQRPRHSDAATAPVGGPSAATWAAPASPTAATPLLKILQQGWRLENLVMAGPTDAACVLLFRDGGAGNLERDASHFEAHGIRFASGRDGIEQSGGCYNVGIFDCSFHDLTGVCVKHTAGAGIAAPYRWQLHRNRFNKCAAWMTALTGNTWEVHDNIVNQITAPGWNTSGGIGFNTILRNVFDIAAVDFDPAGGFTGHATDVWSNYLKDAIETGLPAN